MEKRELFAVLSLSSWCLVIVVWLFLAVPWVCLRFVIMEFPDHTHLLLLAHVYQNKVCQQCLICSDFAITVCPLYYQLHSKHYV